MNEELLLALGRLEGKVDSLITSLAVHDEELQRLENRIRHLEKLPKLDARGCCGHWGRCFVSSSIH